MTQHRKPTNLSLDAQLVESARQNNVNLSRAAEAGIRAAMQDQARRDWLSENAEAIESSNAYLHQHGLPLKGFRTF